MATRRTIRTAKWVIETEGLTEAEHERRVSWVEKNLINSSQNMIDAFVYVVVFDADGKPSRFSGNGPSPSAVTEELIRELVEDDT